MDTRSEKVLSQVHPALAAKVRLLAAYLRTTYNSETMVLDGLRSWADQDALYAKGRTVLQDAKGKKLARVTNAQGGFSAHNFGLAVDLNPSRIDGAAWVPDWDGTSQHYAHMVAAGRAQGLNCGADWHSFKDMPHFQLANIPTTPTDAMRAYFRAHTISDFWMAVDDGMFLP